MKAVLEGVPEQPLTPPPGIVTDGETHELF